MPHAYGTYGNTITIQMKELFTTLVKISPKKMGPLRQAEQNRRMLLQYQQQLYTESISSLRPHTDRYITANRNQIQLTSHSMYTTRPNQPATGSTHSFMQHSIAAQRLKQIYLSACKMICSAFLEPKFQEMLKSLLSRHSLKLPGS